MKQWLKDTLQGTNISHLGKRKIIFKMPFLGDMLVPWRVLLMEEIRRSPPGIYIKPCEYWDIYYINWLAVWTVNSMKGLVEKPKDKETTIGEKYNTNYGG